MTTYIDVPVTGSIYWKELWFRDNSSNPDGVQSVKTKYKIVRSVDVSEFNESTKSTIENTKVGAEVGASYGVESAKVETQFSASKEVTDTYTNTASRQEDTSISDEEEIDETYTIPGKGKLGLWQAFYSAPGVDVSLTDTRSGGEPPASQTVKLIVRMRPLKFIKHFETLYYENPYDRPFDVLKEFTGQSEDFNSGFGGKYVYLKPVYTQKVSEALTDVRVRIQDDPWTGNGTDDLAKGAKGKYRYLQFNQDTGNFKKYEATVLFRKTNGSGSLNDVPGYNVLTTDINAGRSGDWLYVAFKARDVYQIESVPN